LQENSSKNSSKEENEQLLREKRIAIVVGRQGIAPLHAGVPLRDCPQYALEPIVFGSWPLGQVKH